MKNLFLCLLISISSSAVFAEQAAVHEVTNKAVAELYAHVNDVRVTGDRDAKLKDLLQDAAEYIADAMSMHSDDEDSKLADLKIKCVPASTNLANCSIGLDYRGSDFLEITYSVELKALNVVRIHNNLVRIRRY